MGAEQRAWAVLPSATIHRGPRSQWIHSFPCVNGSTASPVSHHAVHTVQCYVAGFPTEELSERFVRKTFEAVGKVTTA